MKNRKTAVLAVLTLLLVAQVVFAATRTSTATGDADSLLVEKETDAIPTEDLVASIDDGAADEEVVEAELNVVYRSTVTSNELTDDFSGEEETGDFDNKIVSYTLDQLPIYAEASVDSEVLGIIYSGGEGDILERGETFTKITSGSITGYVRNVDVLFGNEAQVLAEYCGSRTAVVNNDNTAVYEEASNENVLTTLSAGTVLDAYENYGDYIMVFTDAGTGYIHEDDVSITYGLSTARSMEEIRAEEEAARKAEEEEARREAERRAEEAKNNSTTEGTTYRSAYSATDEEIHLLAAIVYYESGWEPMEGQIAVANVVLNRIYSSEFKPTTIEGVIYSPGQFSGVADNWQPTEKFKAYLAMSNEELNVRGSYDAAIRALNGENTVGDYCFFISVKKANYARYTRYYIINNHCFYDY